LTLFKTEKNLSPLTLEHGIKINNFKAISTLGNIVLMMDYYKGIFKFLKRF